MDLLLKGIKNLKKLDALEINLAENNLKAKRMQFFEGFFDNFSELRRLRLAL